MTGNVRSFSMRKLQIWCLIGLLLSVYATYVEVRAEQDANYVALCDVSAQISCTAVFTTVYGRGFGILQKVLDSNYSWIPPNGVIGFLFYILLFITTFWNSYWINCCRFFLSVLANLLSLYLAYLLYFVLQNLCFICIAIYVVNFNCLRQIWRLHKIHQANGIEMEAKVEKTQNEKNNQNITIKKSN